MKIRSQSTASIIKLLRRGMNGALSTSFLSRSGWPYASMITYATDVGGSPIFLLSDLSDHTKNLEKDKRAGFLVESCSALKRPQTGKRISLLGRINKTKNDNDAKRFLARHPSAKNYVFFKDFNFYKMAVSEVHFIGGFAISEWYRGNDVIALKKHVNDLTVNVDAILDHMNTDHSETIDYYANILCNRRGVDWKMIGVDCDGFDLMKKERLARLDFQHRIFNLSSIREELVSLANEAKKNV